MRGGNLMSGSTAAIITIPIVVVIALFGWVGAVVYASSHPRWRHHGDQPRVEVAGGAFQAVEGGRQVMPIPEREPATVPPQRAAAPEESYDTASTAGATASAAGTATAGSTATAGRPAAPDHPTR